MGCTVHQLLRANEPEVVSVNGLAISRDEIAREVQHHPASKPVEAWLAAARALVVRELLLQRARQIGIAATPMKDARGRRETEEDALIRTLIEQEIVTPEPDEATCRRYYQQNRRSFRSQSDGTDIAFEQASARIANYLYESARRRAIAQYIARLVSAAEVTGISIEGAEAHRVSRGMAS
jgi:peptidyl-prolyl cis-trans isomerase C